MNIIKMSRISKRKLSFVFLILLGLKLVTGDPFVYNLNGYTYGSNATSCYTYCKKGQFCTVRGTTTTCKAYCGDGIVVGTEATAKGCDDGNQKIGDGCSRCAVQPLWQCTGEPSRCLFKCGNGLLQTAVGEQCDDGNRLNLDGCTANCLKVPSWSCTNNANAKSTCTPICGDGKIVGDQKCDDKNTSPNDGCSATCTIETGYVCSGLPSVCFNKCGNSIYDFNQGEVCDNGPSIEEDGCSNDCKTINTGWNCNQVNLKSGRCIPICGDGLLKGIETQAGRCDDGNTITNDGCSSTCFVETGYTCTSNPSPCTPICGDGKVVGIEATADHCDDGNTQIGDGCENCEVKDLYSCTGAPSKCVNLCSDNKLDSVVGEQCDNGKIDGGNNNDGCDDLTCTIQNGWACTKLQLAKSICTAIICGDSIINSPEQCDDGNTVSGDGCSSTCIIER